MTLALDGQKHLVEMPFFPGLRPLAPEPVLSSC
jgi:hypothetical protein